jgi:hypothetical protein
MERINPELKDLFLIETNGEAMIGTQHTIDYCTKWGNGCKVIESLGKICPRVEVFLLNENRGSCWVAKYYSVVSDHKLNDQDFEILRAQDFFLHGQYTGKILGHEVVDGKFIYKLKSELDSGD